MAKRNIKSVGQHLQTCGGQARRLFNKAAELDTLNALLAQHLESPLRDHCQAAKIENGKLTLVTDSAVWLAQLKYAIPDLLFQLRSHVELTHLGKIIGKVTVPIQQTKQPHQPAPITINKEQAEQLQQTANNIQNPRLQAILEKIAKHAE